MRAKETGGKKSLPAGRVRSEPLPRRLYGVSRVPRSYQLKKQRRAQKKRQRQRAESERKRLQRAEARAAHQAAVQARRHERQARRQAKQAAMEARQHEQQARRQAKVAEQQARRLAKQATSLASHPEQQARRQADRAATRASHQAASSVAQRPGGTGEHIELGSTLLQTADGHLSLCDDQQEAVQAKACVPGSARAPVSELLPAGRPLLRLSRGRLQPPHKPMRAQIHHQKAHEPP